MIYEVFCHFRNSFYKYFIAKFTVKSQTDFFNEKITVITIHSHVEECKAFKGILSLKRCIIDYLDVPDLASAVKFCFCLQGLGMFENSCPK